MGKKSKSRCKKIVWPWISVALTALISTVVTLGVTLVVDMIKPVDPRVQLQIEHLERGMKKDDMFISLTEKLTGRVDEQTVETVKSNVLAHLAGALTKYPTRDEFMREKHRYVDETEGVVWESSMENGNMILRPVGPYTNGISQVERGK